MQTGNKMLIFGFKPYHNYHSNITEKIISQLKENDVLKKELFEVKFNEKMFKDAIARHKPSIIIGLGQCSTGNKIRIERKAINEKREGVNGVPKPILEEGPKTLLLNLKIPSDNRSWISYYAWDYVCNFAMYQIIRSIKEKNIKFGFIHIPYDYNEKRFLFYVKKLIKKYTNW